MKGPGATDVRLVGSSAQCAYPVRAPYSRVLLLLSAEARQPGLDPGAGRRVYGGQSACWGIQASLGRGGVDGPRKCGLLGTILRLPTYNPLRLHLGAREGVVLPLSSTMTPTSHCLSHPARWLESLSLSFRAIFRPRQASQQQSCI